VQKLKTLVLCSAVVLPFSVVAFGLNASGAPEVNLVHNGQGRSFACPPGEEAIYTTLDYVDEISETKSAFEESSQLEFEVLAVESALRSAMRDAGLSEDIAAFESLDLTYVDAALQRSGINAASDLRDAYPSDESVDGLMEVELPGGLMAVKVFSTRAGWRVDSFAGCAGTISGSSGTSIDNTLKD